MPEGTCRGLRCLWKPRLDGGGLGGTGLIERIMAVRGLSDRGQIDAFVHPTLKQLHDPSLIPDLDRSAERLLGALAAREPIAIYGDYDVDGITATAILFHMLGALAPGADVRTYIPHRLEEGYGLNAAALEQLAGEGARVVVSVDCGITAREPARAARAAGIDLIITDHHNPPAVLDELPEAYAVVHPRRPDSAYPFAHLSGAGVAYKLAWRLATMGCGSPRVTAPLRELLLELLAFAALGTIADIMPLSGENRVLARFGLQHVKHSAVPGLRALVEASGLAGEHIDAEHVGFALGPRLNACGRMGHAREAVELFTTAQGERAAEIARELSRLNEQRRLEERRVAQHAIELAEEAGMTVPGCKAIVLAHEDWHQGVVGIVCSRLVTRFCRPTILMQRRDGQCHGSGRSIEGFSLHAALGHCSSHLLSFGGHDMAAGLKLESGRLDAFVDEFLQHAGETISDDQLVPSLTYDCDATADELTPSTVARLASLAPFGVSNPRPRLRVRNLQLAEGPRPFGARGKHLSLLVKRPGVQRAMRVVAWNWAERQAELPAGLPIDIVINPKISSWNRQVEPELEDLMILDPVSIATR
jgi:single-stranded-DNA-specific exonuclease